MSKLFVRVTVTQFDDDGGNRQEDFAEYQVDTDYEYDTEALAEAMIEHTHDELKWQLENLTHEPEPPEYTGGGR